MIVSIIGSAGRKDDAKKLNVHIWNQMMCYADLLLHNRYPDPQTIHLCSGGAAFADHIAVELFLGERALNLSLHLPSQFNGQNFQESNDRFDPGRTANYYHTQFSKSCNLNSLQDLQKAIEKGAYVQTYAGFKPRNLIVGKCDCLIAFTFGTHHSENDLQSNGWKNPISAGLKAGGTSHTWKNSNAPTKIHVNLNSWC